MDLSGEDDRQAGGRCLQSCELSTVTPDAELDVWHRSMDRRDGVDQDALRLVRHQTAQGSDDGAAQWAIPPGHDWWKGYAIAYQPDLRWVDVQFLQHEVPYSLGDHHDGLRAAETVGG